MSTIRITPALVVEYRRQKDGALLITAPPQYAGKYVQNTDRGPKIT